MKEIELKGLNIKVYFGILENGLEYYFLPYEDKENYYISYGTKFGSDIVSFEDEKKEYTPPLGIAHYLEHKMFEEETELDPFTFFASSGTDANAQTSFDHTKYICYGNKDFEDNLEYLLTFVNNPYYTDENVEKEKGIIAEEIKMYQDNPTYQLEMKLRENTYQKHPRRNDIAGTIEEIDKITKEDLYKCYNNFYVPNNMVIMITGSFSIEKAEEIIKKVLSSKEKHFLPKTNENKEPKEIPIKEDTTTGEIEVPKIGMCIKVPKKGLELKGLELDLYLEMLTTILFGSSSEFRERVRVLNLLNDIYTEWEDIEDYKTFYLFATTKEPDKLISEIEYELDHLSIPENAFERMKKVWIANEVKVLDDIEIMGNNLFDDFITYGRVIPNRVEEIKNMSHKKIDELIRKIDLKNRSVLKMLPKESK